MKTLVLLAVAASGSQLTDELWQAAEWVPVSEDEGVETFRKELEGFDLVAFRGDSTVDMHISEVMGVYMKNDIAKEWVDMLIESETLIRISSAERIFYNRYDLSFPLSDRDYVLHSRVEIDRDNKQVTGTYRSTTHPDRPDLDCCVRARVFRTYWKFTGLPDRKTRIEVEVLTDPAGMVPTWVVNMVQKNWPKNSINNLIGRAEKHDIEPHRNFADW